MKKKKQETVGEDSETDSDDYDIAEANCELAMVEGQLCSIPYELYDLQDLTGRIFSIETWDSLLTEEERFSLSRFLPDMDQESFGLTMKELLGGGANFYFGNPVEKFYKKLRGGLFAPKVACYQEGVMFFKRKMYYDYSLKFYHEKMVKTFTEMQKLCDQYGKEELGINEKVLLWSERKRSKNKLLDLNRVPSDEMDCVTNRTKNLTFPRGSSSSKNTLKIKITKKGVFRYQDKNHHQSFPPKGLLKVIPKSSSTIFLREPYVAPEIHESGSKSRRRFAATPYSGTINRKPYGTIASSSTTELPKCLMNHQDTSFTCLETTTQSSIDKTEPVLHDPTRVIHRGLGAASITEQNLLTKKEDYPHYHLKPLNTSSETMETKKVLSGKKYFQKDANVLRKPLRVLIEDNHHARETDDDHLFSLTYKRRKVQRIGVS